MTADPMYKPGYEGDRLSSTMTLPERQALRVGKPELVRRLYDAMLTLSVIETQSPGGMRAGGSPAYIVELSERAEQEAQPPKHLFKPTPQQVSDMAPALALLDGLRPAYFKVLYLRALHNFEKRCGEPGRWTWAKIGGLIGMSASWAEQAHDAAVVQAARRAGVLPTFSSDHAVFVVGVFAHGGSMSNLGTAADPRQAVANLKGKSPVRIETALALWVPGQPAAKRVFDEARKRLKAQNSHAAWYRLHPDLLLAELTAICQDAGVAWMQEDIEIRHQQAAAA